MIKVMIESDKLHETTLLAILSKHIEDISRVQITYKKSSNGRFTSISISYEAQSQEQLDAIYTDLSSRDDVIMVL